MKKYIFLFMLFIAIDATAQSWTKLYDYVDEFAYGLAKVTKGDKAARVVSPQAMMLAPSGKVLDARNPLTLDGLVNT